MEFLGLINVPLIIFLSVVLPIWIIFHYATKWKQMKHAGAGEGQTVVDRKELKHLRETAVTLEDRIDSLETVLDVEAPGWREK